MPLTWRVTDRGPAGAASPLLAGGEFSACGAGMGSAFLSGGGSLGSGAAPLPQPARSSAKPASTTPTWARVNIGRHPPELEQFADTLASIQQQIPRPEA